MTTTGEPSKQPTYTRRWALRAGAVSAVAIGTGCASGSPHTTRTTTNDSAQPMLPRGAIKPNDPEVAARESQRADPLGGRTNTALRLAPTTVDLGFGAISTWAFNDAVAGPELRVDVGDTLGIDVANELPEETTVHWHGLTLRNDMDGIHHVTESAIKPKGRFRYEFIADTPGTYWYHSHVGLQADRGLYGPLIVDDPRALGDYDADRTVMIDDWIDGVGPDPEQLYRQLHANDTPNSQSRWIGRFRSDLLRGDAGSINYPHHLINGRVSRRAHTFSVARDGRIRLRFINAGAETAYVVTVGGRSMQVIATDGYPVRRESCDAMLIAPGERYDVLVDVDSGSYPIRAKAVGKPGAALAWLRTRDVLARRDTTPELQSQTWSKLLDPAALRADDSVRLDFARPDREHEVTLTGGNAKYHWGINGSTFDELAPLEVHPGERVRLNIVNRTSLWHPMHLHGHTFRWGSHRNSLRKDTILVLPGTRHIMDVVCDNPGQWMLHCHNSYHLRAGMAIGFSYVR